MMPSELMLQGYFMIHAEPVEEVETEISIEEDEG